MVLTPAQLIEQLNAAGGELYLPDPDERVRSDYRRAIHAAKERRLVPEGFQLWHTGRDRGDMTIRMLRRHGQPPARIEPEIEPEPVPASVFVRRVKRSSIDVRPALANLKVAKALLPRARAVLQALADEAVHRGYGVQVGTEGATLVIVASGEKLPFKLFEEQDVVEGAPPKKPEPARYSWRRPTPLKNRIPSGRLALRLEHRYRNRTWADRSRWCLEDRLTEVLDHVDSLARAEFERQRQAHEQALRDLEAWELAVTAARRNYVEALNRRRIRQQAAGSARAQALRAYADRVAAAATAEPASELSAQMLDWRARIAAEAERVDPLNSRAGLVPVGPAEIQPRDLVPYMPRGMSIYYRPTVPDYPLTDPGVALDEGSRIPIRPRTS
jgi:hypothetical protein